MRALALLVCMGRLIDAFAPPPWLHARNGVRSSARAPHGPHTLRLRGGTEDARAHVAGGEKPKVLLALTGSVATIKAVELVRGLLSFANVQVVTTSKAAFFFECQELNNLGVRVWTDEDEWGIWKEKGDPVQHIELRRWADVLLFAPLSANTLAKLACGLCDNLATCVARAWPLPSDCKRMVVAPAMNTAMWSHPVTSGQVETLEDWGVSVLWPVSKVLVCGDTGVGAMAGVSEICEHVKGLCDSMSQTVQSRGDKAFLYDLPKI